MVGVSRTIIAALFATALVSSPAAAQNGSASLTHTVSVTVPPRVKVKIGSFSPSAPTVKVGNLDSSTQGLSVNVKASQAWMLSIASSSDSAGSAIRWSRDASTGYTGLTSSEVTIASGVLSNQSEASNLFFRDAASAKIDASGRSVVLTVTAP